jgi:predicted dienelactone hydrolase
LRPAARRATECALGTELVKPHYSRPGVESLRPSAEGSPVRVLKLLLALLAIAFAGLLSAYGLSRAPGPDPLSASAQRLRPGPLRVASAERTLVDASRPTPAHGDFAGASSRTLETTLWFPESSPGPHPLLVYSHGFMSWRREAERVARDLASHGFVVVAADHPATNLRAPGGPDISDAPSQSADVSFLIDSVTGWSEGERPFRGTIDPERIGAAGLSLGGFTATLAAFHPTRRDPRISAAVSIAGPSAMFTPRFFETARVPFLMIAGDADAIVDYAAHAAPLPAKLAHGGGLLTLAGGSHAGFAPMADGVMRIFGNPDRIGCFALSRTLVLRPRENPFAALGDEAQGVLHDPGAPPPCAKPPPKRALAAGRQSMITTLALRAFLESVWERDAARRATGASHLAEGLARDFPEASYRAVPAQPASRSPDLPRLPRLPSAPVSDALPPPSPGPLDGSRAQPEITPQLEIPRG